MCTYSMVMDHYAPKFDKPFVIESEPIIVPYVPTTIPIVTADEVRKLIAEFKEAVEAAKTVDKLTHQPDCEDPKKATLVDRVAALEKRLDALEQLVGK